MFLRLSYSIELLWVLWDATKSRKYSIAKRQVHLSPLLDYYSNTISTAMPMLLGSSCPAEPVATIYDQTLNNWKLNVQDGGLQTGHAYISASILDSNENATAPPVCFRCLPFQRNHAVAPIYDQAIRNRTCTEYSRWRTTTRKCLHLIISVIVADLFTKTDSGRDRTLLIALCQKGQSWIRKNFSLKN